MIPRWPLRRRCRRNDRALSACAAPSVTRRVRELIDGDRDIAVPVAAMAVLADMLRATKEQTLIGVSKEIDGALRALTDAFPHLVSLRAGCELFRAHVSQYASCEGVRRRASPRRGARGRDRSRPSARRLAQADVEGLKASLGEYNSLSSRTRSTIAQIGQEFIRDGTVRL